MSFWVLLQLALSFCVKKVKKKFLKKKVILLWKKLFEEKSVLVTTVTTVTKVTHYCDYCHYCQLFLEKCPIINYFFFIFCSLLISLKMSKLKLKKALKNFLEKIGFKFDHPPPFNNNPKKSCLFSKRLSLVTQWRHFFFNKKNSIQPGCCNFVIVCLGYSTN